MYNQTVNKTPEIGEISLKKTFKAAKKKLKPRVKRSWKKNIKGKNKIYGLTKCKMRMIAESKITMPINSEIREDIAIYKGRILAGKTSFFISLLWSTMHVVDRWTVS